MAQAFKLTPELESFVRTRVAYYVSEARRIFPKMVKFPDPTVGFFYVGCHAGLAYTDISRITFNVGLLTENKDTFDQIIGHEVAHIVAFDLYKERGHGAGWKHVMRSFNLTPDRCHDYDTVSVASNRSIKYEYSCGCKDVTHRVGAIIHTKIQDGQERTCRKCKQVVTLKNHSQTVNKSTIAQVVSTPGKTKIEQARQLMNRYPMLTRQGAIELFVKRLGLTKAGASTYYYNIMKQYR